MIHEILQAIWIICDRLPARDGAHISETVAKAHILCQSRGGWEGWLQAEMFAYFLKHSNMLAYREVGTYTKHRQACDLLMQRRTRTGWQDEGIVELKAIGLSRNWREFYAAALRDLKKLETDKISPKYSHLKRASIVVLPGFNQRDFALIDKAMTRGGYTRVWPRKFRHYNVYLREILPKTQDLEDMELDDGELELDDGGWEPDDGGWEPDDGGWEPDDWDQ